jgi:hypothetical protein
MYFIRTSFDKKNKGKSGFVGETVILGAYPQNGDIPTGVEWFVLDINDGKALLISKYALIKSGYCKTNLKSMHDLEWETSLARTMCSRFYQDCFSQIEKEAICEKQTLGNGFGNDCVDYVFLLDEDEVMRYFATSEERKCMPSINAKTAGARTGWTEETKDYTLWWILPETERDGHTIVGGESYDGCIYPKAVFEIGDIQFHSRNVLHSDFCIRPCIMVELSKLKKIYRKNCKQ